MKDLFRIVRHRFLKNNKKAVSTLAIIITFVMVYTLIMPAVALERKAAENEPGMTLEETVSGDAMAEAEPASLEAEALPAEESETESESVVEEESAAEDAAEEIVTESEAPAAAPAEEDSNAAADSSAAEQTVSTSADQETSQAADVTEDTQTETEADPSASDAGKTDAEEGMPAQEFEQIVKFNEIIDEDGNTVEKQVKVKIDAEENAFPAGTVMKAEVVLSNIDPQRLQDMEDAIEAAVKKAAGESGLNADNTRVVQYQAIDINFFNKEGQKIQPAKKVEVRITSDKIREIENPVLVHVNENDKTGEIKNADVIEKKDVSIIDEQPDTIENNENTMLFKSSRFSPFVIVESETVDEDGETVSGIEDGSGVLMTSDGDYNVTVTYDANANIPANAELQVKEITEASRAYQNYMEEAKDVLEDDSASINYAKIIDVDIVSDGEVVTPEAEVDVDIAYKNSDEIKEGTVVQALQFGEGTPAVNDDAFVYGDETHIDGVQMKAVEIPVTAVVGTSLTEEITLPGSDDTYEVSVTYGPEAKIPEGSTLDVLTLAVDSEEYKEAREAVVATKKAADEEFDENDLGFAALDITIKDAQGNPVEPAEGAEVKVSFKMKKLPDTASEEVLADTLEIQHLNESTGTAMVETVAEAQDVTVADGTAEAEFMITSFSTFALTWETDQEATVHYGMLNASGDFVEFDEDKVALLDTTATSVSLDNNFDGYEYISAYYTATEGYDDLVEIEHNLHKKTGNTGWEMNQRIEDEDEHITIQTATVEPDSHIYAIYSQKGSGSNPSGSSDPNIPSPVTTKEIIDNEDGTYTIHLDVEPTTIAQDNSKYANVMIILDRTTSMNTTMGNQTRWEAAKEAIITLIDAITTGKNAGNSGKIDFCLVGFGGYYSGTNDRSTLVNWTKEENTLKNYVNNTLSMVGSNRHGTNWEGGMSQGVTALNSKPDNDPTYVIFVTDGNPNCTNTQQYQWPNTMNSDTAANAAYDEARTIAASTSLYGVFCGASTNSAEYRRLNGVITGAGQGGVKTIAATDDTTLKNEFAAIAQTIINNLGANNVSVDDGVTQLSSVSSQFAGTPGGYDYYISYKLTVNGTTGTYKIGENTYTVQLSDPGVWHKTVEGSEVYYYKTTWGEAPGATFSDDNGVTWDLSDQGSLGAGVIYSIEFKVWPSQAALDLIANLNNGTQDFNSLSDEVKAQVKQSGSEGNYTYTLKTNTHLSTTYSFKGETYTDPVTPTPSEDMPLLSSQMDVRKAFADTINAEDPFTSIIFYLKMTDPKDKGTEKEGTFYYYQTDGSLSETLVTTGSVKTKELPVNTGNNWKNSIFIAPGIIEGTEVLESGHKYTLEEKIVVGSEYEYEFTPQTVRPMIIDTVLTYLVLVDEYNAPGKNGVPADAKTYTIDGESYYVASTNNGELVGTNRKTAELDITKIVETNGLLSDEEEENESFTYRVTLQIPDNNRIDPAGIIGFEYVNRTQANAFYAYGYHRYTQAEWEATGRPGTPPVVDAYSEDVERLGNNTYRRWQYLVYRDLLADSGWEIVGDKVKLVRDTNGNIQWRNAAVDGYHTVTYDMTLKQSELIRFTNLPSGTKYTIQEIYANKYPADNGGNSSGLAPSTDASNIAEEGYAITVKSTGGTVSRTAVANDTVSGEINGLDTRFYNQFTNTMTKTVDVNLAGTKKLAGYDWSGESYHFTLATTGSNPMPAEATGKTEFDLSAENGNADQTDAFGRLRFTAAGTYTYTVSETNAGTLQVVNGKAVQFGDAVTVTIEIEENETTHDLSVKSVTGTGVTWDEESKTATATITNTAPTTTASATKVWENADGTTTAPENAKVTFTLYADGTKIIPEQTVELDGTEDEAGESDSWVATFNDLQKYKVVDGEAEEIVYTIFEEDSGKWLGYDRINDEPVADGGTITNKQMVQKVQFVKEDGTDSNIKLDGAVFTFSIGNTEYTVTSYKNENGLMKTTDNVSEFIFPVTTVPYEMTETTAPAGYNKLTGNVQITSSVNGITAGRSDDTTIIYTVDAPTEDNPNYVVHITNSSGVELPMTGGSGTLPYTLGGLALMMASALMYGFRMRRRERRLN